MSTRFVLVRHGETPSSRERRFAGATDVPLTDHGREQAASLSGRMRGVHVDAMVCSPLIRCRQTAEAISSMTGHTPVIEPRIRELDFGSWENLTSDEVLERDRDGFMRWLADDAVATPGGESWAGLGTRVREWFEETAAAHEGGTILAVTHGGVIMWLSRYVAHAPYQAMLSFEIDPCSITIIGSRRALWRIRHLNDTTHLRDPLHEGPPPKPMPP